MANYGSPANNTNVEVWPNSQGQAPGHQQQPVGVQNMANSMGDVFAQYAAQQQAQAGGSSQVPRVSCLHSMFAIIILPYSDFSLYSMDGLLLHYRPICTACRGVTPSNGDLQVDKVRLASVTIEPRLITFSWQDQCSRMFQFPEAVHLRDHRQFLLRHHKLEVRLLSRFRTRRVLHRTSQVRVFIFTV